MTATLRNAIDRSKSHDEIVHIDFPAADECELVAELAPYYDGCIDSVRTNDGTIDVWGFEEDAPDVMDWRLNVTLTA